LLTREQQRGRERWKNGQRDEREMREGYERER
jgi:hypothetical protein